MNNTNRLISGDNKGYASLLMERYMNGPDTIPGQVSGLLELAVVADVLCVVVRIDV